MPLPLQHDVAFCVPHSVNDIQAKSLSHLGMVRQGINESHLVLWAKLHGRHRSHSALALDHAWTNNRKAFWQQHAALSLTLKHMHHPPQFRLAILQISQQPQHEMQRDVNPTCAWALAISATSSCLISTGTPCCLTHSRHCLQPWQSCSQVPPFLRKQHQRAQDVIAAPGTHIDGLNSRQQGWWWVM